MSVLELIEMCIEPEGLLITLYDVDEEKDVDKGTLSDLEDKYLDYEVVSYDLPTGRDELTINIERG